MMRVASFVVLLACLWPCIHGRYGRVLSRIGSNFASNAADNLETAGNYGGYTVAKLGTFWRSNAIAGFNKMKEGELEEAMQDFQVAISTLAVWDLGQGVVLPIYGKIVNRIVLKYQTEFKATIDAFKGFQGVLKTDVLDETVRNSDVLKGNLIKAKGKIGVAFDSDVNKVMTKFKTRNIYKSLVTDLKGVKLWAKAAKYGDVILGPLFDAAAVGFNIWSLTEAIKSGNKVGIATSSLGIAAGVAGLAGFAVGALAAAGSTLAAVAGPIGAIVGAVLSITSIIIEIIYSNPYPKIEQDINMLQQLTTKSKEQLDADIGNLHQLIPRNVDFKFSWVFEMNQGLVIEGVQGRAVERGIEAKFELPRQNPPREEDGYITIGKNRKFDKSKYDNSPFWNPRGVVTLGYDFYGKKASEEFNGVTVFATTGLLEDETPVKGVDITTYNQRGDDHPDNVLIGSMTGITDSALVWVNMGGGDDAIVFSGVIGKPGETDYEIPLFSKILVKTTAESGPKAKSEENNLLSFAGMSASKIDSISGVEFNMANGIAKYLKGSGGSREKFEWGRIEGIKIFVGTPFNDIVRFPMDNDYNIRQTKGINEYIVSDDSWEEFSITIDDQCETPGKVTFEMGRSYLKKVASTDLVFIEDTRTLFVYGKEEDGRYFIRGKIVFNRRVEGYHMIRTNFDNVEKRCDEFPSTFEAEGSTDITSAQKNEYHFDQNLQSSDCGVIKVLLNPPQFASGRFRIYSNRRKNDVDMVIMKEDFVTKCLKTAKRSLTLTRTGSSNLWLLRLSGKTDNSDCPAKNFEVEIKSFEKFYQEKGSGATRQERLIVDLRRDRRSFIDINKEIIKLDQRISFPFTNKIVGASDLSDVVILSKPKDENPSTQIDSGLYLVGGKLLNEDSLVFPERLRSWLKNSGRRLVLTKQQRASNADEERPWRLEIINEQGTKTHSTELSNVEWIDYEPQDGSLRQPIVTDLETMEAQTIDLETRTAEVLEEWRPKERVCRN